MGLATFAGVVLALLVGVDPCLFAGDLNRGVRPPVLAAAGVRRAAPLGNGACDGAGRRGVTGT